METVFSNQLENKIKQLEEIIVQLEKQIEEKNCEIKDKKEYISAIENNMTREYVEGWVIDGETYYGSIYWVKGEGELYCKDKTKFDGTWDSNGDFTDGKLLDPYDNVLEQWEDGEFIEPTQEE
jgi:hypothetical protein